jgi:hypothetical protein
MLGWAQPQKMNAGSAKKELASFEKKLVEAELPEHLAAGYAGALNLEEDYLKEQHTEFLEELFQDDVNHCLSGKTVVDSETNPNGAFLGIYNFRFYDKDGKKRTIAFAFMWCG